MHHFPRFRSIMIFNSSQFCLQETTLEEDWPGEGCGVCAWRKTEPKDSWAASPSPAQEGENNSAAPEHPWGSHVLGQLQAPPPAALAGKEKSQQEFFSVPLQDKANTMPDQAYKVLSRVIWIKLMSKGNCWRCRTTQGGKGTHRNVLWLNVNEKSPCLPP